MKPNQNPPRILIIGGGSVNWSPTLLKDLALHPLLPETRVVLYDIDGASSRRMETFARRLYEAAGYSGTVETATSLREALAGADFIILTVAIGFLEAMGPDLEIPARYGIQQTVGDTVGPGGWSRALRHIPFMVELAELIKEICPGAWLLNYTNPMTVLTRTACRMGVKCIGLCHEVLNFIPLLAEHLEVEESSIQVRVGGINHLPWALDLRINGRDGYPAVKKLFCSSRFREAYARVDYEEMNPFADNLLIKGRLLNEFGYLPLAGDRHLAEFFPYFLTEKNGFGRAFGVKLTPIEFRLAVQELLSDSVQGMADGELSIELKRSREAAADIIAALWGGGAAEHVVNIPNRGQFDNLPREAVVECSALVEKDRVTPLTLGSMPPPVAVFLQRYIACQEMVVQAVLEKDREAAVRVLLLDPMIDDLDDGRALAEELMAAHARWLPW